MGEQSTIQEVYDYGEILQTYAVSYYPIDYYWQVGTATQIQGWVIHLSVIRVQFQALLQAIIPGLLRQNLPFRIIRDAGLAFNLLEGQLGYKLLGKMVCIYPGIEELREVVKWLLVQTASFRGPRIPTDRHLGGIVYTRYGSINPLLIKNSNGEYVKHIYNIHAQIIPDPYDIPFSLPEGIAWPFWDLASPEKEKSRRLLNYKYYPLVVLKPDAKGNVIKGLYFKKLWQIKPCLLKQGSPNMFADRYGRDIQDRLKWQYELYQNLHEEVPMPQVFDYFEEEGNTYLVMEFIKGQALADWITAIYDQKHWIQLQVSARLQLLDQLIQILEIISLLHKKGYIHRDITPANFLVDKRGKIFLIDMELTWSAFAKPLQPPFELGTAGHMSPEQMAVEVPTVKEDVYGVGSLVFVFLTNYYALKINQQEPVQLASSLQFFIDEPTVAHSIAACWSKNPLERPNLEDVTNTMKQYREKLTNGETSIPGSYSTHFNLNSQEIIKVVQGGLNNQASPSLLNFNGIWISQILQKELYVGNRQMGMAIYEGWHTGLAGPLWLVALAKRLGFSVESCQASYNKSWDYIENNYFGQQSKMTSGLYAGNAGIALALVQGINSQILAPNTVLLEKLQQCFSVVSVELGLAEGIAGQGLALLQSLTWLDGTFAEDLLISYVQEICKKQRSDGSWNTYTGIDNGAAGIILFLLCYMEKYPDGSAARASIKALGWLERIAKKEGNSYTWSVTTNINSVNQWSMNIGLPGIVLTFIKAYEILKDLSYRRIAEQCLINIPRYPLLVDFSLGSGIAGLGETYLEAFCVFKDSIWQDRAKWIAEVLMNSYSTKGDTSHWLTFITENVTTADLFSGNGGIIHFLMHFLYPEKVRHPLLAKTFPIKKYCAQTGVTENL